jgi:hypothetical protein
MRSPLYPSRVGKKVKNAFRSDDPDAIIPQHDWKQGPDFRSGRVEDAGFAAKGVNRPKVGRFGGDAPSARSHLVQQIGGVDDAMDTDAGVQKLMAPVGNSDAGLSRLIQSTEQIVPFNASKKQKRRLKNGSGVKTSGTAAFRWT